MITKEETEKNFKKDLRALLDKYNAEMSLYVDYSYMGGTETLNVTVNSVYDSTYDELLVEYADFDINDMLY